VTVAPWFDVTEPAEALKVAVVAPAATLIDAGTEMIFSYWNFNRISVGCTS
jgi:hypothetical protein